MTRIYKSLGISKINLMALTNFVIELYISTLLLVSFISVWEACKIRYRVIFKLGPNCTKAVFYTLSNAVLPLTVKSNPCGSNCGVTRLWLMGVL